MKTLGKTLALIAALVPVAAFADEGSEPIKRHIVQAGWFHVMPQVESHELQSQVYPAAAQALIGSSFSSPGTGSDVSNADTLALLYQYFFADHWSIKFEGGIPADFDFTGHGLVQPSPILPSVDLGAYPQLATVKQWSPVLLVQYYFGDWTDNVRPYVGVGVTYTWFTDVKLNEGFETALNQRFGTPLSVLILNPGQTYVTADAKSDIAPVFNAGVSYDLTKSLNLSASVSYSLLETTATIDIFSQNGTHLTRSEADVGLHPVVVALLLGYRFSL
jgi:outer membrane protein